ncbi:MAG: cytochrome c biogenesis CcdA family protein [bacterium]|nr:cytochrome c biogenesis CcdA family protein [bacterium]
MDILLTASILAAFLAGAVALFAPCCITVLLPAYMASAFRQKQNMLRMTFVFFAGISVILVPIGMGAAGLAAVFENYHRELYIIGGSLMIVFAVMSVLGKGVSLLPSVKQAPKNLNKMGVKSVFVLGIFSGAATSCCAPVLAGAMTLAVISGVFWKGVIVTFAYVFGMTLPLFLTAYFYDRFRIEKSKLIRGKIFEWRIGGKQLYVHSTNLFSGFIFALMGIALLAVALSGNPFWAPEYQVAIGENITEWSKGLFTALSVIPDIVWGAIVIGLFILFLVTALRKGPASSKEKTEDTPSCCRDSS